MFSYRVLASFKRSYFSFIHIAVLCHVSPALKMNTKLPFPLAPRILSIQSHTIHGYVGNKAATFPLQTCGYDVDAINTVQLSNEPSYPNKCKGHSLTDAQFQDFIAGLEENDLLGYDMVMTGYMRSPELLRQAAAAITKIRSVQPKALYVCDPVLGDDGAFYVPPELLDVYREELLPLATAITPNAFESQVLSGVTITDFDDACKACEVLHSLGPELCILKGLRFASKENHLSIIVSFRMPASTNSTITTLETSDSNINISNNDNTVKKSVIYRIDVPTIPGDYAGVGDVFSAITAAFLTKLEPYITTSATPYLLGELLEIVTTCLSGVVANTRAADSRELCIIESRNVFIRAADLINNLLARETTIAGGGTDSSCSVDNTIITSKLATTVLTCPDPVSPLVEATAAFTNNNNNNSPTSNKAYVAASTNPTDTVAVIFDMDGTLTLPGAIDFSAIYRRLELNPADGDVMSQISRVTDESRIKNMLDVVYDEEMKGCDVMIARHDLGAVLTALQQHRIRTAISTRNCGDAYLRFIDKFQHINEVCHRNFHPVIHRDSLGGVNKPDPRVAQHILQELQIRSGGESTVWFVGDSEDDVKCGKAAGCRTCLILTDYNRQLAAENPGLVDLEVEHLADFVKFLGLI